uniref:Uncharacterized protein n=1 Tax=Timema douglasi TaxID=61478 RepID=A0A7R8VV21_TIMDO|nr:unnamed protein product [Timema douglasi]
MSQLVPYGPQVLDLYDDDSSFITMYSDWGKSEKGMCRFTYFDFFRQAANLHEGSYLQSDRAAEHSNIVNTVVCYKPKLWMKKT